MNIVEELVVTLGLDSSKFVEGQKHVSASMKQAHSDVTGAAMSMEKGFGSLLKQISGLVIGFEGLKDAVRIFKEANREMIEVYNSTELLFGNRTTARDRLVRSYQEFSAFTGADKNALSGWILGRRQQITGMMIGGINPMFYPALLGINPLSPQASDPKALAAAALADRGGQLAAIMPLTHDPTARAEQFLTMVGLDPALAAEYAHPDRAKADMARARKTSQSITDPVVEANRKLANELTDVTYKVHNLAAQLAPGLLEATKSVEGGFGSLAAFLNSFSGPASKALAVGRGYERLGLWEWGAAGAAWADVTNLAHGNLLSAVFGRNHTNQFAVLNAAGAIPNWAANWSSLIGGGGQGGTSNSFAIGNISVNTSATDAAGIAAAMNAAIQRKFAVSQGDGGMH